MEKTALLLGESEHNLKEAGGEIPPPPPSSPCLQDLVLNLDSG